MPILGSIFKRAIDIRAKIPTRKDAWKQQQKTLRKLLTKAQFTAFGEAYGFSEILKAEDQVSAFQKQVPTFDYSSMFKQWWYRALNGEPYVSWPNHIKYFALSSGTSESSSKHIPVTRDMIKAISRAGIRQLVASAQYGLSGEHYSRGVLMLGGSTHLNYNGTYFEGDLSGITTGTVPFWFQHMYYKPGPKISRYKDWNTKLEEITKNAKNWDIGIICGVPAWIQILFEKIIAYYNVKTIHDIWPNLKIYVHGGVAIGPYLKSLEKLVSYPLIYNETYLASEGFIAYQARKDSHGMRLLLDNGIFYEFVPFNEENFDSDGKMLPKPQIFNLTEVEENKDYALLISTCSGAWRYLIGDTIRFSSIEHSEIIITGRTKHFLSLCGEHLSVDNMNKAISMVADELNIEINEYTVAGIPYDGMFAHHWYVGSNVPADPKVIKEKIDKHLMDLNDDYRVERIAALKDIFVDVLPDQVFIDFLASIGKVGAQIKFPRVMKGKQLEDWIEFVKNYKATN